jgi:lipid II:glycine glycyltransferase (peptidoglycan interpeptide bridge formation enzyme)
MKVIRELPEDEWRHFVEGNPQGNIFHTPEMFQVFNSAKNHRPELWAVKNDRRILALLLPVQVTIIGNLLRRFTTRSVAYGSVLYVKGTEGQKGLALLLETYTREVKGAPIFTELRNLSDLHAIKPILSDYGFVYEDNLNYLIDLKRPPEAIMQSFGRSTRKKLRRALKRGEVVVEEVKELDQIAACYDLLSLSYRSAQVPLADRSLFEAAFDLLYPKNMIRFTLARVDQTPVATVVDLLYKDTVYGWYGGLDRAYGFYMPNELLHWHIFQWGAEKGYHLFDFGGAGKPDEDYGVRDFKAKFRGQLVCYGRNTYVHKPRVLRMSALAYKLLRKWL